MYFLCFPLIPIWTAASPHSSQLVIILPLRFCHPFVPVQTPSFQFGSPLFPCAFAPSIIYIGACTYSFWAQSEIDLKFLLAYCEIKDQMDKQQWHSALLESLRPRSFHAKSPIPLPESSVSAHL
ncbi:uncharacterized protein EI90DRAFT_3086931 [Cantharellus anzutake]|uniref:uncharacterized protein n=1 Tax=Cantharellus anzutake TaxID=1750568 RepID=UPI001905B9EB|nr:uncharacterized protein EI90DRAFT_3086931 [Cantharellus anzutake]KAF8316231.1 hypothetical protein EI90DRAFT_3086931 [Cantharellus anzutake]